MLRMQIPLCGLKLLLFHDNSLIKQNISVFMHAYYFLLRNIYLQIEPSAQNDDSQERACRFKALVLCNLLSFICIIISVFFLSFK